MRVLLFGTYDSSVHPRVGTIAEGLRARGVEVAECNAPLGLDTAARVDLLARPWRVLGLVLRLGRRWATLVVAARRQPAPDAVLVGYLGHFDVHLARLLFRRVPVVLDHLVGAADTGKDRRLDGGARSTLLRMIDAAALRSADLIVTDTEENRELLAGEHADRALALPVGAPAAWSRPTPDPRPADEPLRVVFFGPYTPLHGTPVIGAALGRLAGQPIEVTMIGTGQDEAETKAAAAANPAVRWLDWVPAAELPDLVAAHDVCLGIFGTGGKALRVVPNKVFQGAAAGCAIVTSDTAPQRRAFGEAAVLVPAGDAGALAATLLRLAGDRAEVLDLRRRSQQRTRERFTAERIAAPLVERLARDRPRHRDNQYQDTQRVTDKEQDMASGTGTAGADLDAVAPLTPNAWLRYDVIERMLPAGVTDVLEVGCGQGALGARLAGRYRYLGVEPDRSSWEVADRRVTAVGRGEARNATVEDLAEDERFDLVCAFEVLEHIEDDAAALRSWARRLRPGGWLLLSVPAYQSRYGAADELVGHFRRYDPAVLVALLERCGFEQVEPRQYGVPLGYLLEAGRNAIGRRRLAGAATTESVAERTAGSGRLLQPSGAARGIATRVGTAPFRALQRAFPHTGTGLVVRARLAR